MSERLPHIPESQFFSRKKQRDLVRLVWGDRWLKGLYEKTNNNMQGFSTFRNLFTVITQSFGALQATHPLEESADEDDEDKTVSDFVEKYSSSDDYNEGLVIAVGLFLSAEPSIRLYDLAEFWEAKDTTEGLTNIEDADQSRAIAEMFIDGGEEEFGNYPQIEQLFQAVLSVVGSYIEDEDIFRVGFGFGVALCDETYRASLIDREATRISESIDLDSELRKLLSSD